LICGVKVVKIFTLNKLISIGICILFRPKRKGYLLIWLSIFTPLNFIFIIIPVLVNVAFITLLERKILGYSQLRKGPNKVGFGGIPQPFNDAIKLFSKEIVLPITSNLFLFLLGPTIAIVFRLLIWSRIPVSGRINTRISIILIYMLLRINIYPLIISGWSSNRNYASIGCLRGVAQTISYEIRFALIILFFTLSRGTLNFNLLMQENAYFLKGLFFIPILGLWIISCLAETNRTPFDFAEGESELVSGFNVEYGSVGFALIFIAEYARIYFISTMISILFFSWKIFSLQNIFITRVIVFFWVWVRTTLPRYRYDILMSLAWVSILPVSLIIVFYSMMVQII